MSLPILTIRLAVSLVMISFGISQVLNPSPWIEEYMPEFLKKIPNISPTLIMRMHSLGNIALGIMFLLGLFTRTGSIITLIWWLSILPFAFYGSWKTGVRDLAIIASILAVLLLQ